MGSIDEYVKTLTPELRDQHKVVIEECRIRELNIKIARAKSEQALAKYYSTNLELKEKMGELYKKSKEALNTISDVSLNLTLLSFQNYCKEQ